MLTPPELNHGLKQQLRLWDLALMQILLVVGIPWIGIAGRQGSTHVVFWIASIVLFFIPSAIVVNFCAQRWPEEGGVYQWAKYAIGPFAGFLSAWNLCLWAVFSVSNIGIVTATSIGYAFPNAAWIATSRIMIVALTFGLFILVLVVNLLGVHVSKWFSHFGTVVTVAVALLLTILLFWHPHATALQPHVSPQQPFSLTLPALTLISVNLFAKIAFHSFGGLEQVAVFAGETRNPSKTILQSAWIAAPICALLYIVMTGSLLTYIPAGVIDLAGPIPQVLSSAFSSNALSTGIDWGSMLGRSTIFLLAIALICQYILIVAQASRLPMVAGWDGVVPARFTALHPRWKTPTWSIAIIVLLGLIAGLLSLVGAGQQEAFQLIVEGADLCFAVYYLIMFLVPLTMKGQAKPKLWIRAAALSGLMITLLAMVFSLVPIVPVASQWLFAAKIAGTTLLMNLIAIAVYRNRIHRLPAHSATGTTPIPSPPI